MHEGARIQKVLARFGYGSRREVERWIREGRLFVNGQLAELGCKVGPDDNIKLDGKLLSISASHDTPKTRLLLYHKPVGEVCTRRDPEGRRTVFGSLPKLHQERWVSVGRLDINTSGLLLFTNNGELAQNLMHPGFRFAREYAVRVLGELSAEQLQSLRDGVMLAEGMSRFASILPTGGKGANHWYNVVLMAGRNREVRRLFESQDVTVSRLIRIRYGDFCLPTDLPCGCYREASAQEIQQLSAKTGCSKKLEPCYHQKRPQHLRRRKKPSSPLQI